MTRFRWTDDDKARLLTCDTREEMLSSFPQHSLQNLISQRARFRAQQKADQTPQLLETIDDALSTEKSDDMVPRSLYVKALRERDQAKDKVHEYISSLREAVFEAAEEIQVKPLTPRKLSKSVANEEIAALDVGDWQLGKLTPTYNSQICEDRVKLLAQKVNSIIEVQRADHPVNELHLRCLGDMVEGEGIFPSQAHAIDSGFYRQIFDGVRIMSSLILDLLETVDRIHVVGVIGNHGQVRLASGTSDPETNMDRMLYQIVRMVLEGHDRAPDEEIRKRVTWDVPDGPGERNWFAVDRIFDWGHLLAHGDQIRGGFAGFPFYGTAKKAWGWIDSVDEPWDHLHFGHWHTPTRQTLNRRIAICNGSTESNNTYAQEQLAAVGFPSQWLGFVSPTQDVTAEYWVNLGGDRVPNRTRGMRWGS